MVFSQSKIPTSVSACTFLLVACFSSHSPGHSDYMMNHRPLSPWHVIDGWNLGVCFHDPMHVMYLGTCRDLYASALGFWVFNGFFGVGSVAEKLRTFSYDLKEESRRQKLLSSK